MTKNSAADAKNKSEFFVDYGKTVANYPPRTAVEERPRPLWMPPEFQTRTAPVYFEITVLTKDDGPLSKRISLNEDGR